MVVRILVGIVENHTCHLTELNSVSVYHCYHLSAFPLDIRQIDDVLCGVSLFTLYVFTFSFRVFFYRLVDLEDLVTLVWL